MHATLHSWISHLPLSVRSSTVRASIHCNWNKKPKIFRWEMFRSYKCKLHLDFLFADFYCIKSKCLKKSSIFATLEHFNFIHSKKKYKTFSNSNNILRWNGLVCVVIGKACGQRAAIIKFSFCQPYSRDSFFRLDQCLYTIGFKETP